MIKLYLLIAFSIAFAFAIRGPFDAFRSTNNLRSIDEILDSENDSPSCKKETKMLQECGKKILKAPPKYQRTSTMSSKQEKLLSEIPNLTNFRKCIGKLDCEKNMLAVFYFETIEFAMEKIYNFGYECWNEETLLISFLKCAIKDVPEESIQTEDLSFIFERNIAKCAALERNCGEEAKLEFYRGAAALADFYEIAMRMSLPNQKTNFTAIQSFNMKFEPNDFEYLYL
ncbi:unnamed protein product [Caenorhabditis nigoni]